MFPFKEDLCRFDFEVDSDDEYMCYFGSFAKANGVSLNNGANSSGE